MTTQPIDPRSAEAEAVLEAEEGETETFAATAAGTDRDAELEELIGKADVEPSLDEILRLRTRGER